jgi:hypothetical protein
LKVAYEDDNKTFVVELFKIFRSSSRKWAVNIENFEKKIHDTVKILGSSKKQHGTFSSSKLLADSKSACFVCLEVIFNRWTSFKVKLNSQI